MQPKGPSPDASISPGHCPSRCSGLPHQATLPIAGSQPADRKMKQRGMQLAAPKWWDKWDKLKQSPKSKHVFFKEPQWWQTCVRISMRNPMTSNSLPDVKPSGIKWVDSGCPRGAFRRHLYLGNPTRAHGLWSKRFCQKPFNNIEYIYIYIYVFNYIYIYLYVFKGIWNKESNNHHHRNVAQPQGVIPQTIRAY